MEGGPHFGPSVYILVTGKNGDLKNFVTKKKLFVVFYSFLNFHKKKKKIKDSNESLERYLLRFQLNTSLVPKLSIIIQKKLKN